MKKLMYKFSMAAFAAAMLVGNSACTKSFEEVNTDPDGAKEVPTDNQLGWVLRSTSYYFYDRWFAQDEPMTFCGYVSKASYIDESRYQYRPGVQDSNWAYVYRILNNIRTLQQRAPEGSNTAMICNIMEAHVMLIATDRWRDVPYSNACKMGEGYLTPTYDTQEQIYPALLKLLKETADQLCVGSEEDVSEGDVMFWGDMDKWQRYCNSLRLRIAIRLNEVSPDLAKSTIEEVLTNPAQYPIMESNDDNALFWWDGTESSYYEMIADAYRTRKSEFCAPDIMVDYMNENEDPRIGVYFTQTVKSETDPTHPKYAGHEIGAKSGPMGGISAVSLWGYKYGQDLGGFSPWMRVAEVKFIIAEAIKYGYNAGSYAATAEEAYNDGILLSMEENEVDDADAEAYLANHPFDGSLDQIWYEEWVAMFKQGMEGWSLYRRTGVPKTNHIANGRAEKYANHNTPPFRSPYPATERDLNGSNNAQYDQDVVDDFWGKRMWWDKRPGDLH
ncbi:MAG: SusD/RagB family nutrient-binding outer membrane lipoprotein [Bacteroidaceae bacterium]|nr:SusD/RagB family nutrient-binding outer membrane lipoprotein [Bacteroidaceae bacterium]